MTASLELIVLEPDLYRAVAGQINDAVPRVQRAMADELYRIIMGNFGPFGIERPYDWAQLSEPYAKKVKRDFATLHVSGALQSSVIRQYGEETRVYQNNDQVPYAMAHAFGYSKNNLPARSVWPITEDGQLLPFTEASVIEAANEELRRQLGIS